jgi:proteasome lid subunit RPN8/RPN11
MIEQFSALYATMKIHAMQCFPEEACGLIVNNEYLPCNNVHSLPLNYFAIDAKDYAKASAKGDIQAIFHSHPNLLNSFSSHDIAACKQSELPWVLYCTGANQWVEIDPSGKAPYLGRPWQYGIYDCYALMKDFYGREFNIILDDFDRGEEGEWENPEWQMFEKNVEQQGFIDCDGPIRKGDMLLMQMQASFPNHAGFIVSPASNIFYQHLMGRISEQNVYGGYWAKVTNRILRHKDLSCN